MRILLYELDHAAYANSLPKVIEVSSFSLAHKAF